MNLDIIYPALLIVSGILLSAVTIVLLTRFFNKILRIFELYPESRSILNLSFKIITMFISLVIFLLFARWALRLIGLEFTTKIIESIILASPKYILAVLIILCGFYISRVIREKSKDYEFEFKNRMLLIIDFIVHMTFVFTALYSIGVSMTFFLEFYKTILWIIGAIVALIVSMTIGIPLGISIHERMKRERKRKK